MGIKGVPWFDGAVEASTRLGGGMSREKINVTRLVGILVVLTKGVVAPSAGKTARRRSGAKNRANWSFPIPMERREIFVIRLERISTCDGRNKKGPLAPDGSKSLSCIHDVYSLLSLSVAVRQLHERY